jgi:hypothetical protein
VGAGGVFTLKNCSTQECMLVPKLKYHFSGPFSRSMYCSL